MEAARISYSDFSRRSLLDRDSHRLFTSSERITGLLCMLVSDKSKFDTLFVALWTKQSSCHSIESSLHKVDDIATLVSQVLVSHKNHSQPISKFVTQTNASRTSRPMRIGQMMHYSMRFSRSPIHYSLFLPSVLPSLVQQESSWGRFCITQESFERILSFHRVFPPFLDFIYAYGVKFDEDNRFRDGHHEQISYEPDTEELSHFGITLPTILL